MANVCIPLLEKVYKVLFLSLNKISLMFLNKIFIFYLISEVPSPDEVEVYIVLQECLEMRKRYVFKEAVAPWEKEVISDPSTPKPNPAPFFYAPEGKSDVSLYSQSQILYHKLLAFDLNSSLEL